MVAKNAKKSHLWSKYKTRLFEGFWNNVFQVSMSGQWLVRKNPKERVDKDFDDDDVVGR